jgi:hypothetical protein
MVPLNTHDTTTPKFKTAAGYIFVLSPNQTPTIDAFIIQKLVGLKAEDPYQVRGKGKRKKETAGSRAPDRSGRARNQPTVTTP